MQQEQAEAVFDRCVLLLEPTTSSVLHKRVAWTGLFSPFAEPSWYLITWVECVTTGVSCVCMCDGVVLVGDNTANKRRTIIVQG